jgi:UDP-N-acetylglucosamine acyltransferase
MTTALAPKIPGVSIHPTAIVAREAELGAGVSIGPWCSVGPNVTIQDGARLVSHVVVDGHSVVGPDVVLFPFCTVGLEPQDLKYKGEPTRCEIGARTQIREHCTIHRGTVTGRGITRVGADCLIMAVAHVAHDCQLGDHVIIANNAVMGGHVSIGDHAVIGGAAAIHQFVRIGRAAMIGGVSGVEADVIPFGSVIGNRARLAGLNVIGLKRRGFDKQQIGRLHTAFAFLFRHEGVFRQRLAETRERFGDDPLVAEVLAFIDAPSHRGLIRAE